MLTFIGGAASLRIPLPLTALTVHVSAATPLITKAKVLCKFQSKTTAIQAISRQTKEIQNVS
ncbi:hypothetical protein LP414_21025 [Polaromonas sp. P1(28)-13]|nr:hypothetical protein LP414_21025 [Polaromonas sp. P1(28)-13]